MTVMKVKPYLEPLGIFQQIGERNSELSDDSLGFICGIIRDLKPGKIVEVGVSSGGTSAVILKCLQSLGLHSEMWSIDLAQKYHYDTRKQCGYQIKQAAPYVGESTIHHLVLEKNIAQMLPQICSTKKDTRQLGGDIDLLILDTIHYLPGELLDFIVCLPYLSDRAVVIVDDLYFCHRGENTQAVATRVLYSAVVADRLCPQTGANENMQAFRVNKETRFAIDNLFQALVLPWHYAMSDVDLIPYADIIQENYDKQMCAAFEQAVLVNKRTLYKQSKVVEKINELFLLFEKGKPVYIYGAGKRGAALGKFLQDRGMSIAGYVISNGKDKEIFSYLQRNIFYPNEIPYQQEDRILVLAAADETISSFLQRKGIMYWEAPNYIFPFIKQYADILL